MPETATPADILSRTEARAEPIVVDPREEHESEVVVAIFRTFAIMLVLMLPRLGRRDISYDMQDYNLFIGVATYNLIAVLLVWRNCRIQLPRALMLLTDLTFVSVWIWRTGGSRSELFPLFYLLIIVAAIWYRVFGALVVATLTAFLTIYIYTFGPGGVLTDFQIGMTLYVPFYYLAALLAGYLAEATDRERVRHADALVLVGQYQNEMAMSRQIQDLLIPPTPPQAPGLDLAAATRLARVVGGGDYYDVLDLGDRRIGICIADVAGKSVSAQIRLPLLKYALRAAAPLCESASAVIARINDMVYADLQPDLFIGCCYAVLDLDARTCTLCNAGHVPPVWMPHDGEVRLTTVDGPALGIVPETHFTEQLLEFRSGDGIFFYTDGVTSARSGDGTEFGESRLMDAVCEERTTDATAFVRHLMERVEAFERGAQQDDLTMLCARRTDDE